MNNEMTLGKLKSEIDKVLEQGIPEDTVFTAWDSRGNIKRIDANSFALRIGLGAYVKILK